MGNVPELFCFFRFLFRIAFAHHGLVEGRTLELMEAARKSLEVADTAALSSGSAATLLALELRRGGECRSDFSLVDHFELAPLPLADVRAEFGVRPPDDAADGHHFAW